MRDIQDLRKEEEGLKDLKLRSKIIFFPFVILFFLGVFKIIQLSIINKDNYEAESERNRIIELPVYPSRGLIKLKDGTIVAENIVFHELFIDSKLLNDSAEQINFLFTQVLSKQRQLSETKSFSKKKSELLIVDNLTDEEISRFKIFSEFMPNLKLKTSLRRYLPHKNLFSHVTGHLGPVSKEDRIIFSQNDYSNDALIGKVGVERAFEELLKGKAGKSYIEVDVFGNRIREINRVAPLRSKDITLTLDINLQRLARQELNSRRGAIVALDPSNGHIKAMVSSPDYNPNILNRSEFDIPLAESSLDEAPFFNRAISGSYPPASTIKPFIGLLGLEEKIIDASTIIEDVGFFQLKEDGRRYRGWKEDGHGKVNLEKAIVESSDVFFYELSSKLTIDRISSFLAKFGFGETTGIELLTETESILPTRNWKLGNIGETWFVGDTINIGIGQGYITSTPLQLAVSLSAIANRGIIYKPTLVTQDYGQESNQKTFASVKIKNQSHWEVIEKSMISVINSWNGTAHNLYKEGGTVIAGKTGTAQIRSLVDQELTVSEEYEGVRLNIKDRDHALFASYGPVPDPNLVVVVIVENGESGSAVAAPIAQKLIEEYQKSTDYEQ